MCWFCDTLRERKHKPARERRTLQFWSGAHVLLEMRQGMGAPEPHPDAALVPWPRSFANASSKPGRWQPFA